MVTAYIVVEKRTGRVFMRTRIGLSMTGRREHALVLQTYEQAERLAELRGRSRFDIEAIDAVLVPTERPQAGPKLGGRKESAEGRGAGAGEGLEVEGRGHARPHRPPPESL